MRNRVRGWSGGEPIPDPDPDPALRARAAEWLAKTLGERLPTVDARETAETLVAVAERQASLARRDAGTREDLLRGLPLDAAHVREIPLFAEDVHALAALDRMGALLIEGGRG